MNKRCQECERLLDASSFNGSSKEPDGLAKKCRACVNRRRRQLNASKTGDRKPAHLGTLVKQGDYGAVKSNASRIDASNRDRLLALAVRDFKSAPKKPSHVELVKFLIQMGARPDFHLVCAATVGPHVDIMSALIEAGAEANIFTSAALGDVERLRDLLRRDSALAGTTTDSGLLGEVGMSPLHYTCRSELGKVNQANADRLARCAKLLLRHMTGTTGSCRRALSTCARLAVGASKIAQLLMSHGCAARRFDHPGGLGTFPATWSGELRCCRAVRGIRRRHQ